MINLIPPQARQSILLEYWIRVFSVWCFLLAAAGAVLLALLFPTYILIHLQLVSQQDTYADIDSKQERFTSLRSEIRNANTQAKILSDVAEVSTMSHYLSSLDTLTPESIVLNQTRITRDEDNRIQTIVIAGEASTRTDLAQYRAQLEQNELFAQAELPLSNLAKDKEVPFRITLETPVP